MTFSSLRVAGLAEKRPSVRIGGSIGFVSMTSKLKTYQGDLIFLQENKDTNKWFEGHVHVVHRDEVGLCFHTSFGNVYSPNANYRVRFKLNRIPVPKATHGDGYNFQ